MFLSQWIDLSLGGDELQKSPGKESFQLFRQTKLCKFILLRYDEQKSKPQQPNKERSKQGKQLPILVLSLTF